MATMQVSARRRLKRATETEEERAARLAYARAYYQANRDKMRAQQADRYRKVGHDRLAMARSQKRQAFKRRVRQQARRAREATGRGVSVAQWSEMLDFFGHRCFFDWCESIDAPQMAHLIALANGGRHDIDNVVPLCSMHNQQQGTRAFFDFFAEVEQARADRGVVLLSALIPSEA